MVGFFVNVSRQTKVFFLQCRNFFKKLYAGIKEKKFLKEKCLILWQQSSQSFFWFNLIRSREEVGRGNGVGHVSGGTCVGGPIARRQRNPANIHATHSSCLPGDSRDPGHRS